MGGCPQTIRIEIDVKIFKSTQWKEGRQPGNRKGNVAALLAIADRQGSKVKKQFCCLSNRYIYRI